jgi:hypothetical protein
MVRKEHLNKMPNPLGRRRVDSTPSEAKEEISKLKEELNELRKLYIQDMSNVSNDMRALVSQLSPTAPTEDSSETPVVEPTVTVIEPSLE